MSPEVYAVIQQALKTERHRLEQNAAPLRAKPNEEFIAKTGILNSHYVTEIEAHIARVDAALSWLEFHCLVE